MICKMISVLRFFVVASFWGFSLPAFSQNIDFKNTKANVTFEADTSWIDRSGPLVGTTIYIRGEINQDTVILVHRDYDLLANLLQKYAEQMGWKPSSPIVNVELDSVGGSVDAAIEIGRFLRAGEANAIVAEKERCASACLFILAGAVTRTVNGSLGIHRPFLETPSRPMTTADVKRTMTQRQEQLRAFFREMNIAERLADDMMMIPSAQIKWLSPEEIGSYGLGVDDPVIKETKILVAARKYGLSRMEYEARWRRVQEMCDLTSDADCEEKVMTAPRQ